MSAIAFANSNIAIIAWSYPEKIPGCLGFSIRRVDVGTGAEEALPAWVGFEGEENPDWTPRTTDEWPVQKFNWRDLTARRGGVYRYRVIPMGGARGALRPLSGAPSEITNQVEISGSLGAFSAYFNRGILATQSLARTLGKDPYGIPDKAELEARIDDPSDPLRASLSGELIAALKHLLDRADREGGSCYSALYELSDPELSRRLIGNRRVRLILSNTGADDRQNAPIRRKLHASGVDITDRFLGARHIGHNKFVVYVDRAGKPQAVLTGSTNWTAHGLCAQTNNAVIVESPRLAAAYLRYWKLLKLDSQAEEEGEIQSAAFRRDNAVPQRITLEDGTSVVAWFAPNTKQKRKSTATPPDLAEVFEAIGQAKQAILFLAFQPGSPSFLDAIADAQTNSPDLFVRGALTRAPAPRRGAVDLYHLSGRGPDATVIQPSAVRDAFAFWEAELLSAGHAIIHDKIVVIDPFSQRPVVITGSHNLGFTGSYANDENFIIARGHHPLAAAYATHVMDVYDHFRWRHTLETAGDRAWSGLVESDRWQDKYFREGSPARRQLMFWMSGGRR